MNVFFDNCSEAVDYTAKTKTYGIFHSVGNNPNLNIHTHDACEILFCKSGGRNFLIDDKIYHIEKNDLFILNQFEAHKITYAEDEPVERYVIQIHPEFIFNSSTDESDLSRCFYLRNTDTSNRLELDGDACKYVQSQLDILRTHHLFGDDVIKNSALIQLLAFINEKFSTNHPRSDGLNNLALKNALLYINENLASELTLEVIAKNSYISVNQLCKIFKASLGTTVKKYIIGKRISQAKKYLKSGHNVSDTAFLCGFRDYSNFIRVFSKSVGISPGKYSEQ